MTQSQPKSTRQSIHDLVASPVFQGVGTAIGILVGLFSENRTVRIIFFIVASGSIVALIWTLRHSIKRFLGWLTWKFALGLVAGAVLGALLTPPVLEPAFEFLVSLFSPKIEIVNIGQPVYSYSDATINFSQLIPPIFRRMVRVDVWPDTPHRLVWGYDGDSSLCCRTLVIEPLDFSQGRSYPEFKRGQTYVFIVKGPFLKQPYNGYFYVPSK